MFDLNITKIDHKSNINQTNAIFIKDSKSSFESIQIANDIFENDIFKNVDINMKSTNKTHEKNANENINSTHVQFILNDFLKIIEKIFFKYTRSFSNDRHIF